MVDCVWNVMAHAQEPDFVFRRNVRVHLNRRGRHFSRLLAAEVCASAVVMLYTPCSEVVWRVLATHSIRQFPLHLPSRALPCAITFQLDSTGHSEKRWKDACAWGDVLRRGTNRRYVGGKVNITLTSKLEGNDFVMTLWFPLCRGDQKSRSDCLL